MEEPQFRIKVEQKIEEEYDIIMHLRNSWKEAERAGNEEEAQKYHKMYSEETMYRDGLVDALRLFEEEAQKMPKLEVAVRTELVNSIDRREQADKDKRYHDMGEEIHLQNALTFVLKMADLDPYIEFDPYKHL